MGLAILVGFIAFFALNAIFGLFTPICVDAGGIAAAMGMPGMGAPMPPTCISIMDVSNALNSLGGMGMAGAPGMPGLGIDFMLIGMLAGSALLGMIPLFTPFLAISIVGILLGVIAALVAGVLAGLISRGAASRGFMSGFSSVVIGYYIALVILVLYAFSVAGGMVQMGGADLLPLLGVILIIPIVIGIIGGIGGAIMSAILASPAPEGQAQASTTNIIQAPAPASAPVVVQGDRTNTASSADSAKAPAGTVKCPACGTENSSDTTFCQSCGTRLKS